MIQALSRSALAALLGFALSPMLSCLSEDDSSSPDDGGSVDTPLNWVPTESSGTTSGTSGDTPLLWIDPQGGGGTDPGGGGGGGGNAISTDTLVYEHGCPLRTQTIDTAITTPENNLFYQLTQFRQTLAGTGGIGGGGLGGIPGGGTIGGVSVIPHTTAEREISRAHCKHMDHCFLIDAPFFTDIGVNPNPEGDDVGNRLDLNNVPWVVCTDCAVQGIFADAVEAFAAFEGDQTKRNIMSDANWTRVGCGYWPGATDQYYCFLFIM